MEWKPEKESAEELLHKAYELQMQGKIDEAIPLYQQSIELHPTAEAHTYLGWSYSLQNRFNEAIDECKKAIELDPEFGNPYNDIGSYLIEKGEFDHAIPWLEKALRARRYDNYCYPHYNLGRVYQGKGDWFRAFRCYEDSLRENSEYTLARRALNNLKALLN